MISGSMVALITPMLPDGEVDWKCLADLVEWHIEEGTHSIVAAGTTGESATLSVDEHIGVIKFINDKVAKRIPVIAGTGANSTREAIELTSKAQGLGVDACLLVTPYYNKPTQKGLILHYEAIAKACPGDLILYNVPGRTSVDMLNDSVVTLSAIDNIIGIKDATGDVSRGIDLIQSLPKNFAVYSGDDATAIELILAGAKGDISVTANVKPSLMSKACEAALQGNVDVAKQLDKILAPLHQNLFVEANPIPVKWAMGQMGKCHDSLRLPLCSLSKEFHAIVSHALEEADK